MKTASAYVVYDPLSVSLGMEAKGGSMSQRKDAASGEWDPDRTLFPLQLKPRLIVKDPNHVMADGDYSDKLIDARWYLGTDETGVMITRTTTGYMPGDYGELTVGANIEPDNVQSLYFSCAFIDPRTQKTFRYKWTGSLSCVKSENWALQLEIDCARKMPLSPMKTHANRTITATLRNGGEEMKENEVTWSWRVKDSVKHTMRAITADDIWYVSGLGTRALTIDRRMIDKELIELVASPKADPTRSVSVHFKAFRWYGQWDEREVITRGKFVRRDTREIEIKAIVDTPKGEAKNPTDYWDITHYFMTNEKGSIPRVVGYGETVVLPATIAGRDPNVVPVFGVEVKERTALRAATMGGKTVMIGGKIVTLQIAKE